MRLGIFTGGAGETDTLDSLITQAQPTETAGFASFWLPNLLTRNYDALLVMALAGRATTHIELGTAAMPTYPRHPMAMAQEAMTANAATRGRLALGIGLSHRPVIEDVMGLSYADLRHGSCAKTPPRVGQVRSITVFTSGPGNLLRKRSVKAPFWLRNRRESTSSGK
jgi:alkanesulfonate monooxygenase SsuD/methylene tetrahydromethanopterin reductase-like flavin-dependent oxidoreductase (luciferase family)